VNTNKTRKLLSGEEVVELPKAKTLKIRTRCPEKWKLIDMETGEVYIGYSTEGKNDWQKVAK
jgi:hypothetical protein